MIPGLVSMLGAVAGAALGRSNPGLLSFVVGFGAGTGKSTSSALPEQVPSAGIASLGTTAVTAGKGISWPRAQGRRNLSSPPSSAFIWHWNNSMDKGNSLPNCQVSIFHRHFAGKMCRKVLAAKVLTKLVAFLKSSRSIRLPRISTSANTDGFFQF